MLRRSLTHLLPFLLVLLAASSALAQGSAFTYQGRLTNSGSPANGNFDMQFKLFDTAGVGTGMQQGPTLTLPAVPVANGVFSVDLDFTAAVFDGTPVFLEIGVRAAGSPDPYTILAPRQAVNATPYAVRSATAAAADTATTATTATNATQFAGMPPSSFVQFNPNGNVGIGVSIPLARLAVSTPTANAGNNTAYFAAPNIGPHASNIHFGTTGDWFIRSAATTGKVILQDTGGNVGIGTAIPQSKLAVSTPTANSGNNTAYFEAPAIGPNVSNIHFGTTGDWYIRSASAAGKVILQDTGGNVGIGTTIPTSKVEIAAQDGLAITGFQPFLTLRDTNAGGARGIISSGNGDIGFYPNSFIGGTTAVIFKNNGSVGIGTANVTQAKLQVNGSTVNGVYASSNFHSVWGESFGANAAGLRGSNSGSGGFGVHALATGDGNSVGVYGESTSSVGFGVFAKSPNHGVWGKTTGSGRGVFGDNGGSDGVGYAGYFFGRVNVTGFLTKGAGAFKIDHPLDPENKYLLHSFVESPDMMNIYNGNITTDDDGNATVTLPDWFEALNKDFRYQLTVIGQFAQAIIARKIQHNRFTIKTDKPNVEVSWQVTGIRHDAYAKANRIPVEQEKPKNESGYYLHPHVFGQPEEKGVEWARQPELLRKIKEPGEQAQQQPQQEQK